MTMTLYLHMLPLFWKYVMLDGLGLRVGFYVLCCNWLGVAKEGGAVWILNSRLGIFRWGEHFLC